MAKKQSGQDEMVFLPLGGVGEIGMNMGLYGFGPADDRKWLVVDCGVSFGGPEGGLLFRGGVSPNVHRWCWFCRLRGSGSLRFCFFGRRFVTRRG